MSESFTPEQLQKEKWAKDFPWDARTKPEEFDPVQLKSGDIICGRLLDWWNTRSSLFCCCFSCFRCCAGTQKIDGLDKDQWKKQIEGSNSTCPDSMKGLWWLQYNYAAEELVTIFGDAEMIGTFNEDGTDGYGEWRRPLKYNWTRENAIFGHILSIAGKDEKKVMRGRMNLKDGIVTVHGGKGQGIQVVYRVNNNEWWKIHYKGNPGEEGEKEVEFMYKWLKVLDKDGNQTEHWDEYVEWTNDPLPHDSCGSSWLPCWACCLSGSQRKENMCRPNKEQVVVFKS